MLEKIEILKENNDKLIVDVVSAFKLTFNNAERSFCIVTNNELDQNGLVKLMVSEISNDKLIKISDEDVWTEVKNLMRAIISSSSYTYSYVVLPKTISASNDFFRIIAVQEAAKTQLISDYMAKKPSGEVVSSSSDVLVDNPAIYPNENPEVKVGDEVSPGIGYTDSVKEEEEIKPIQVTTEVSPEVVEDSVDVSMDDLVKSALSTASEPTAFQNEQEKTVEISATSLIKELEDYIRQVVRSELDNKNKDLK